MSRRSFLECDRCAAIEPESAAAGWARAFAQRGADDLIGTSETAADFCPDCTEDLLAFLRAKPDVPAEEGDAA